MKEREREREKKIKARDRKVEKIYNLILNIIKYCVY